MEPHVFETHYNGEHKLHWSAKSAVEEIAGWLFSENKEKLLLVVKGLSIGQSFSLGDLADGEVFRVGYGVNEMTTAFYYVAEERANGKFLLEIYLSPVTDYKTRFVLLHEKRNANGCRLGFRESFTFKSERAN